ncbi:MAG: 4-hydroxyphenylacetate 3-hydroxylase N-terminal domain-containing protein [Pseudomonadota bacterium]|nr:4-hydroxyphenylacetate 3-hydroxylase N-terminal domain-containing protein [Pseudomonadota bacterium]
MAKTGEQHLESLRDGREVFLDGKKVDDVTTHPAYKNAVAAAAALYDFQADPDHIDYMTFESPTSGERVNRCWQLTKTYEELVTRRKAIAGWSQLSGGWLGRSPDHIASSMVGQVMGLPVFEKHSKERAKALVDYFEYVRDSDAYMTYVIINPQADRNKGTGEMQDEYLATGVVDENSEGITVRGAKMLGTGSIMANEVLFANIQPLKPGEEKYAISFALPMNAKGLKVMSRRSYEASASSVYDYPLSSRFDENDALVYCDDVKVPWDRVFIYKDTDTARAQFQDTYAHYMQNYQAQIRLMVKMQFQLGVARRITETIGTVGMPPVAEKLGQLAAQAAMVEGLVYGMESGGGEYNGYYVPDRNLMYTAQVLTQQLYPEFITSMRELAGGGLIMLPSSADDFANPELNKFINATQKSAIGSSEEKVKFMKLAWDAIGSEFASRHTQYEMFYAGAQFVTRAHAFRTYDWERASNLVDSILDQYSLSDVIGSDKIAAE